MELVKISILLVIIISKKIIFKSKNFLLSYMVLSIKFIINKTKYLYQESLLLIYFLMNHYDQNITLTFIFSSFFNWIDWRFKFI